MNLSPTDIESKAFTQALRGYQMDEVDDFLDEVMTTLKAHEQRLREAQDRIRSLESDLASRGGDESTISRAFLAAQRSADALIADAETQAVRIKREAEAEASRLKEDRDTQRNSILDEITAMRTAVTALKSRLTDLAGSVGHDVAAMESALNDAETEVREPAPVASPAADGDDDEAEPVTRSRSVQSIIDDLPKSDQANDDVTGDDLPGLDLTEEPPTRVSARPWERG
ncbi:MAG TPA: DivIVA domain-containing protein [Acidimicrobiia bacterium]|nr:DivIVA domain-containing protein [Acidimicrobiia bacterium]